MVCGAYRERKQTKTQYKNITDILTSRVFELLHMEWVQLILRV